MILIHHSGEEYIRKVTIRYVYALYSSQLLSDAARFDVLPKPNQIRAAFLSENDADNSMGIERDKATGYRLSAGIPSEERYL